MPTTFAHVSIIINRGLQKNLGWVSALCFMRELPIPSSLNATFGVVFLIITVG